MVCHMTSHSWLSICGVYVYTCSCVCAWMNMCECTCGGQRSMSEVFLTGSRFFGDKDSYRPGAHLFSQPLSAGQGTPGICLSLHSRTPVPGSKACATTLIFFCGCRELNPGPVAHSLATEPSPQWPSTVPPHSQAILSLRPSYWRRASACWSCSHSRTWQQVFFALRA